MIRYNLIILLLFSVLSINGQDEILHVEPPNWWFDMESKQVEILIHGNDIGAMNISLSDPAIKLVDKVSENNKYLFLLLDFAALQAETTCKIELTSANRKITIPYNFYKKEYGARGPKGVNAADAIYLITPDRFRNGSIENDNIDSYKEKLDRTNDYGRHGGDIEGIIQSVDYINKLGFNTVWLNPVLENDMESQSYHGYATTDFYTVDKRFGGNERYEELRDVLQSKNMKLIMDMIANHCGSSHWWMEDLPFDDWLNYQEEYLQNPQEFSLLTNHRKTSLLDPYGTKSDRDRMIQGWFVPTMPDLNQKNVHMSRYIIQNSIWWVETMQLAGIRQDTYSYPEEDFLSDWSCALLDEFPDLFVVGEEWSDNPLITSYWQKGEKNTTKLSSSTSCLPSVMDFPLQITVNKALIDKESWNSGLAKMYEVLVNDILYAHPEKLVIFPDNHDMSRVFTQLDDNYNLWKMAMVYYATMRGIPQIYYGTEVLLNNPGTESHGVIRSEMQGGWDDHSSSVFADKGLSVQATEAKQFIQDLYNWRKTAVAIHEGELRQYIPHDGIYVYFRILPDSAVMVVYNKNEENRNIDLSRFTEYLSKYTAMNEIIQRSKDRNTAGTLAIEAMSVQVWELR